MEALLVLAHPSARSLNARLAEVTTKTLTDAGYAVLTSDLYAMNWNPAVTAHDFGAPARPDLPVGDQSAEAYTRGSLSGDIVAEQEKLSRASLVVFHFPLWWYGMPAILKGWFDRVFVKGFAFGLKDDAGRTRKYGDGGLAGKRALTVITAGDRETAFDPRGLNGEAGELFFPFLHGIFWYTGMRPLRPHLVAGTDRPGWDRLDHETDRLRTRLHGLEAERPIPYRALADGEYDADRHLRGELAPGRTGLGIHLG
ncbi:NAD(P)H-dependent oxidoreductase [Amycolatopsis sp. 195334CR]|uniref:NAD(P)H-dependent oxidoreductase n=1 Tax=Amycolatopsis sp. 195334CR TaxID=2814588 RepID=UPI001A906ED0|nr:NAD(P)H-dependent oxidoreductase [Amycolatopsis sp. 195334CR]MBN6033655.1 NAD(P)H-dependent oxidoreductase [Amycolatopsis sp. 195334CR]